MTKRKIVLALCALYLLGLCAWFIKNALEGDSSAIPTLVSTFVVGALVGVASVCFRLKKSFIAAFSPDKWGPGKADEFPLLEVAQLEQLTREWEELGFECSRDQVMSGANKSMGTAFSRTFEHPTGAVAVVMQQFLPQKTLPFTSNVSTFWGERETVLDAARDVKSLEVAPLALPTHLPTQVEPDLRETLWVFLTHNHAPNKFWTLMRQKRLMSERLPPASSPQELWSAHQECRAQLEKRLGEPHLTGELVPLLDAHSCVLSARLSRQLKRTPAWKFGLAFISRAPVPAQYDGELPQSS